MAGTSSAAASRAAAATASCFRRAVVPEGRDPRRARSARCRTWRTTRPSTTASSPIWIFRRAHVGLFGFYLFGGTSASSPQWAGIAAIANQKANHVLGFINSALYEIGASPQTYASALHDIRIGNNSVVQYDINGNPVSVQGFKAGKGWDATTGLGSPTADQLVGYLIKYVTPADGTLAVAQSSSYSGSNPGFVGHERPH